LNTPIQSSRFGHTTAQERGLTDRAGSRQRSLWRLVPPLVFLAALGLLVWHGWSRLDHRPLRVMYTPTGESREVLRLRPADWGFCHIRWSDDGSEFVATMHELPQSLDLAGLSVPRSLIAWVTRGAARKLVSSWWEAKPAPEGLVLYRPAHRGRSHVLLDQTDHPSLLLSRENDRPRWLAPDRSLALLHKMRSRFNRNAYLGARFAIVRHHHWERPKAGMEVRPAQQPASFDLVAVSANGRRNRPLVTCRTSEWSAEHRWYPGASLSPGGDQVTFLHDAGLWLLPLRCPIEDLVGGTSVTEHRKVAP
jgi:hypothetical protein